MQVGWIGLGSIGELMALRVMAAGHGLTAYARGKGQDAVRSAGGRLVDSYAAVACAADVLCINVFDDGQVRSVSCGAAGAMASLRPGAIVAVHTTGSPDLVREMQAQAPPQVAVLDATFSGGPEQARNGTLTVMVGGRESDVARAEPVFMAYASRVLRVGDLGAAQVFKLLNNSLFAAHVRLAAQTLEIGERLGVDPATLAGVLGSCSAASFGLGLFAGANSPAQVLEAVKPYLDKDVSAARQVAGEGGIDLDLLAELLRDYG